LAAGFTPAAICLPGLPVVVCGISFDKSQTLYRKESSPVAERPGDERKPFGFPLITSVDLWTEMRLGLDERVDVAEAVVAVLQQLVRGLG
jgi:hypothetical protein